MVRDPLVFMRGAGQAIKVALFSERRSRSLSYVLRYATEPSLRRFLYKILSTFHWFVRAPEGL